MVRNIGPGVYPIGVIALVSLAVGLPVGPSVVQSNGPSVGPSLDILETAHKFFFKLCMKLGVNKVKKVTLLEF